ncbi:uncharacterized protein TrAtP1_009852 [Trichoderma atroviride]|uniref:NmrA-like domain-containing protein n=1 Tax=Hypocrea atroviridis (strain ATCC 20476 / IMI 206040) TaxID=452589 RepID=G9NKI6_HYPAI|nr:uncharacterized protein TRIATDRAFT_93880 [Trichoderma atroviride IMI 206040]EHK48409.1 hypothetical protein TRIATDRAFT_93880 [Trichoderma atroviride IMI 206040]UKZ68832.1 hypothetical protein TrAtP1_009852 [Trichoderma atroviride]
MPSFNRIAVYGHRGWASSAIVDALIASGAPLKVLYRHDSDVSRLPDDLPKVAVDLDDEEALIGALEDVDILISLVGHEGVIKQYNFIRAIPKTNVKLFVPSDLGYRVDEEMATIPVLKAKAEVEKASKDAGIPTTVVLPGNLAESTFDSLLLGIDVGGNRIVYTGDSEHQKMNICTRKYIAAAYAAIFTKTPISQLQNRSIGLSEFIVTGSDVAAALERKHGTPPQIFRASVERVTKEIEARLQKDDVSAISLAYRLPWATGKHLELVGTDVWDVAGYQKTTLDKVVVEGDLEPFKAFPPQFAALMETTFF